MTQQAAPRHHGQPLENWPGMANHPTNGRVTATPSRKLSSYREYYIWPPAWAWVLAASVAYASGCPAMLRLRVPTPQGHWHRVDVPAVGHEADHGQGRQHHVHAIGRSAPEDV